MGPNFLALSVVTCLWFVSEHATLLTHFKRVQIKARAQPSGKVFFNFTLSRMLLSIFI